MNRRAASALAALPLALALVLGGCAQPDSGDGIATASGNQGNGGTGESQSPTENLSVEEKALKFAQCMRDNGVDMPDPELNGGGGVAVRIGGEGQSMEEVDAAMQACRQYAPFDGGQPGQVDPKMAENMLKFAQCMRDNGVETFPDPDGNRMMIDSSVGDDPDFPAAQEKCEKEFMPGVSGSRKIEPGSGSTS